MRMLIVCCGLLLLLGCERTNVDSGKEALQNTVTGDIIETNSAKSITKKNSPPKAPITPEQERLVNYLKIEWTDLIPQADLDALLNPPEYITNVEDGSIEDQIPNRKLSALNAEKSAKNNYEKALISTNVVEAMGGEYIEIPGFIVPVGFDDKQVVTSFFLVPYFGACLHMPPPPPNQIIYIEIENGFMLEEFYEPVVVSGQLSVELMEDQIATSAYTMTMEDIRLYYENE